MLAAGDLPRGHQEMLGSLRQSPLRRRQVFGQAVVLGGGNGLILIHHHGLGDALEFPDQDIQAGRSASNTPMPPFDCRNRGVTSDTTFRSAG